MERIITKVEDSFGAKLYEGDIIEYFDWCHAKGDRYVEEGVYNKECSRNEPFGEFIAEKLPIGFKERALANGFNCIHEWNNTGYKKGIEFFKPLIGIVKWNDENVTYEPLIESEGYFSFFELVKRPNKGQGTTSYCKKIGNVLDNPELLDLIK